VGNLGVATGSRHRLIGRRLGDALEHLRSGTRSSSGHVSSIASISHCGRYTQRARSRLVASSVAASEGPAMSTSPHRTPTASPRGPRRGGSSGTSRRARRGFCTSRRSRRALPGASRQMANCRREHLRIDQQLVVIPAPSRCASRQWHMTTRRPAAARRGRRDRQRRRWSLARLTRVRRTSSHTLRQLG